MKWIPPAEVQDKDYLWGVCIGRSGYCITITTHSKGLNDHCKTLRRGRVTVKANVTKQVPEWLIRMAFHFREAFAVQIEKF